MVALPDLSSIRIVGGKMEPTRTYSARWWRWLETPGLPCDGIAILGQVVEKSGEVDEQHYGVCEVKCVYPGGRSFAVRKLGSAMGADDEMYTTTIMTRNSICTCTAGRTRNEVCRHRCGLEAAIAAGAIPSKTLVGA